MVFLPNLINSITFGDIMFWIYALVVFILVLGIIIILHEGGHFFFAKRAGILCHEFSIGMGPVVKSKKKGETSYSIRAIPIGGFVSMAGEDTNEDMLAVGQQVSLGFKEVKYCDLLFNDNSGIKNEEPVKVVSEISTTEKVVKEVVGTVIEYDLYSADGKEMYIVLDIDGLHQKYLVARDAFYVISAKQQIQMAPYERCYESKTKLQRFLTVFAGPLMNFVLALLIFIVVGLASGVPDYESRKIGSITSGYPASSVLQAGDEIISIDGKAVNSWNDVSKYMNEALGNSSVRVTFIRDDQEITKDIPTINYSYRLGVTNAIVESKNGTKNVVGVYSDTETTGLKVTLLFDDSYVVGEAGLVDGDVITQFYSETDKEWIKDLTWGKLIKYLEANPELNELRIMYSRNGGAEKEVKTIVWTQESMNDINSGVSSNTAIGIAPEKHFDFLGGLANAFILFWNSITAVFVTLGALFGNSQISINELSGPVGIFGAVKSYLGTDILTFLSFVGLISANIGLVNLLPLPALDGGRIIFIGYELITGKKVNKKVETTLINIVFWLVMLLFVYITCKDIIRMF